MISRERERLGGLALFLLGLAATILVWSSAVDRGYFLLKAAGVGPGVAFIGLALLVVPGYRRERVERGEDISGLTGTRLITRRWWGILAIGLLLGLLKLYELGLFGR
jgi:hypothetical protein